MRLRNRVSFFSSGHSFVVAVLPFAIAVLPLVIVALTLTGCSRTTFPTAEQRRQSEVVTARQWWCYPLPGAKVISPFGQRSGRMHSGTDLKTKPGDNILAAFDGEVVFSGVSSGYGNLVRIKHQNGLETYYAHNVRNLVTVGQQVRAGDVIALTGRTGRATTEHLHFETRIGGKAVNSTRFFDHESHTLKLSAFRKTSGGYTVSGQH